MSRSVETFIKAAPTNVNAATILKTLGNSGASYPQQTTLCNASGVAYFSNMVRSEFEIAEIDASEQFRRLDLKWVRKSYKPRWIGEDDTLAIIRNRDRRFWEMIWTVFQNMRQSRRFLRHSFMVAIDDVQARGLENVEGFVSQSKAYLLKDSSIARFIGSLYVHDDTESYFQIIAAFLAINAFYDLGGDEALSFDMLRRYLSDGPLNTIRPYLDKLDQINEALASYRHLLFDPYAWDRRRQQTDD